MDRRSFFGMMVGGLATVAAVRSFPFRVFSFPKEVMVPSLRGFQTDAMLSFWENEEARWHQEGSDSRTPKVWRQHLWPVKLNLF